MPSLCCSALVALSKHPDITRRLLDELEPIQNSPLTPDVLSSLSFLQCVWKEVTRIAPPFGGGFREVLKTFELEVRKKPPPG